MKWWSRDLGAVDGAWMGGLVCPLVGMEVPSQNSIIWSQGWKEKWRLGKAGKLGARGYFPAQNSEELQFQNSNLDFQVVIKIHLSLGQM